MGTTLEGVRVGRYTLVREIGAGGMGVVYLGQCADRSVAIKTMAPYLFSDPKERAQFIREARTAARIRHPNVVETLELVTDHDGKIWHVMQYVDGLPLDVLLRAAKDRGDQVPVAIALRIFVDLLHGLGAAYHARGDDGTALHIVHRDVSPANVLVGRHDGIARVLDFGIAKTATHQTTQSSGGFRGKVRYVAPEQIKGLPAAHPSDIYSACVVAWEMFAGRPLYQGETSAITVTRVLVGTVPSLRTFNADVPPELDACLCGAIVPDADQRPQDAEALAQQLERSHELASAVEVALYVEALAHAASRQKSFEDGRETAPCGTMSDDLPARTPRAPSVSAVAPRAAAPPARSSRRPLAIAGAIAGALLVIGGAVALGRATGAERPAVVAAPPAPAPTTPATVVEVTAVPSSATAPTAPEPAAAAAPTARHRPKGPPPPPAPGASRATRAKVPDCRVPTFLDERGISRIRPECL